LRRPSCWGRWGADANLLAATKLLGALGAAAKLLGALGAAANLLAATKLMGANAQLLETCLVEKKILLASIIFSVSER